MSIPHFKSFFNEAGFFLIPEVGLAHAGSFTVACAYIDLVAELGLKAIKFQHHQSEFESSNGENFRTIDSRIKSNSFNANLYFF